MEKRGWPGFHRAGRGGGGGVNAPPSQIPVLIMCLVQAKTSLNIWSEGWLMKEVRYNWLSLIKGFPHYRTWYVHSAGFASDMLEAEESQVGGLPNYLSCCLEPCGLPATALVSVSTYQLLYVLSCAMYWLLDHGLLMDQCSWNA